MIYQTYYYGRTPNGKPYEFSGSRYQTEQSAKRNGWKAATNNPNIFRFVIYRGGLGEEKVYDTFQAPESDSKAAFNLSAA